MTDHVFKKQGDRFYLNDVEITGVQLVGYANELLKQLDQRVGSIKLTIQKKNIDQCARKV